MNREELLQLINLTEELVPAGRPNRKGEIIRPSKITIHNTSNRDAAADAAMHSRFVRNTGYYITKDENTGEEKKNWVSWHFSVDDKIAIRHLPPNEKALHAGTAANNTSIAIEVCMNKGIDQYKANLKAAQLTALLCYDLAIPVDSVVTHKYWTGKNCPELLLASWSDFLAAVTSHWDLLRATEAFISKDMGFTQESFMSRAEIDLCWTGDSGEMPEAAVRNIEAFTHRGVQHGFNEDFLDKAVELPVLKEQDAGGHVFLHHQNLSIYFNKNRKLALYTACNFNKEALFPDIDRSNAFRTDDSIDTPFQLEQGFYLSTTLNKTSSSNYFDRGHLIARRYNQWGQTEAEALKGERDTYVFTAIHPQVEELNKEEWEELEGFIINRDKLKIKRVSVIAGGFLRSGDPVAIYIDRKYKVEKSVQIPEAFWKVVYYEVDDELRKISFVMSQRNRLKEISFVHYPERVEAFTADPFDKLGDPLKTYIVNSSLIESVTGLSFSAATELYQKTEPLEVVMKDNETHPEAFTPGERFESNIVPFI